MSFAKDFQVQWTSFTDYIVSRLIEKSTGSASDLYQTATSAYNNEILRWTLDGQYNAEWLNDLKNKDAAVAERFLSQLEGFRFHKAASQKPSSAVSIALAGGGALVGVGAGLLLHLSVFPVIGIGVAAAAIGGIAGSKVSEKKITEAANTEIDAYKKQLKDLGNELLDIVSRADS